MLKKKNIKHIISENQLKSCINLYEGNIFLPKSKLHVSFLNKIKLILLYSVL